MKHITEYATKMQKKADCLGVMVVVLVVVAASIFAFTPLGHPNRRFIFPILCLIFALTVWSIIVGRKASNYKRAYLSEVMKKYDEIKQNER
jgi:amino acid permease